MLVERSTPHPSPPGHPETNLRFDQTSGQQGNSIVRLLFLFPNVVLILGHSSQRYQTNNDNKEDNRP